MDLSGGYWVIYKPKTLGECIEHHDRIIEALFPHVPPTDLT